MDCVSEAAEKEGGREGEGEEGLRKRGRRRRKAPFLPPPPLFAVGTDTCGQLGQTIDQGGGRRREGERAFNKDASFCVVLGRGEETLRHLFFFLLTCMAV